ncbi:hypothetical protein CEUSTIGMA_g6256.t1 [Chlamydomonas eustigma]|uniref:RRM domain-containing protein n=1 Tax=Chlamydomonas eustigma TaxID=1157962 RepID=A0A250X7C5_9CHLO|nr:hypothetical protein CEUSTIGMA_g6256.t1 [Chlamydomonas eustigma]|eukprot:GAX78819.1 hypothetical protein CEUSTIGMA_g6256.t1 [Chlamydomonas eustigma]
MEINFLAPQTTSQAARAINRLNDTNLGGRNMYVRMDRVGDTRDVRQLRQQGRGPASSGGGRRCYVNNLAWQTGWQDLKDKFREAGRVVHADVMVDEKGRSKGWGMVEFETTQEALNAISKLNEAELHGRLLQVREDKEHRGAPPVRAVANSAARMRSEVHPSLASGRPSHSSVRGTGDSRCRCYVGNLAWQTGWKDLKDVFREAGRVVHADVMLDETGRSKGCGIVEFETEDEARMAIARLHDRELHGRLMHVREDREEVSRTGIAKLRSGGQVLRAGRCYVGNLAYTTTWQVLKDKFKTAGRVLHADVVSDETGCSKGFGLVEFETEDEAARAIAMLNDSELDGRRMYVREDRVDNNGSTGGSRVAGIQPSRCEGTDHATSCQGGGGRLGGRGRCYVGNLAWQTGWQDLKDKFREAGRVVHADVMLDETGRSKGYGIIEFETEEEVKTGLLFGTAWKIYRMALYFVCCNNIVCFVMKGSPASQVALCDPSAPF